MVWLLLHCQMNVFWRTCYSLYQESCDFFKLVEKVGDMNTISLQLGACKSFAYAVGSRATYYKTHFTINYYQIIPRIPETEMISIWKPGLWSTSRPSKFVCGPHGQQTYNAKDHFFIHNIQNCLYFCQLLGFL